MLNIPRSKDVQTIKLGQLIEYNKKKMFLFKLFFPVNEAAKLFPDHFLFFEKAFDEGNAGSLTLSFSIT